MPQATVIAISRTREIIFKVKKNDLGGHDVVIGDDPIVLASFRAQDEAVRWIEDGHADEFTELADWDLTHD